MRNLLILSLLASMALSMTGCDTTTGGIAPGNTTLGSAAIGGLGGAAVGAMTGHGTKGALVGAGVGTLGGAVVGQMMENNNRKAAAAQQGYYGAPAPAPAYRGGAAGYGAPAPGYGAPPPQSF